MAKFNLNLSDGTKNTDIHVRLGVSEERKTYLITLFKKLHPQHEDISIILKVLAEQCETINEVVFITYLMAYNMGAKQTGGRFEGGLGITVKNGKISGIEGLGGEGVPEHLLDMIRDAFEKSMDEHDSEDNDEFRPTDPADDVQKLINESFKINGKPGEPKSGEDKPD